VEAARHAIGRIADITADKHMEGVRLTRWLLSPIPTFLLWRRMKLWELRSYDQVIKLEQERLVYQARLRSRYGRTWRRTAPVEALMPLRLARYGVPLADTAPAGPAAAGIEQQPSPAAGSAPLPAPPHHPTPTAPAAQKQQTTHPQQAEPQPAPTSMPQRTPGPQESARNAAEPLPDAYQAFLAQFHTEPTAAQRSHRLRNAYGITTQAGRPLPQEQVQPLPQALPKRDTPHPVRSTAHGEEPMPTDQSWDDQVHSARSAHRQQPGASPETTAPSAHVYEHHTATADGDQPPLGDDAAAPDTDVTQPAPGSTPLPADQVTDDHRTRGTDQPLRQKDHPRTAPADASARTATHHRGPQANTSLDTPAPGKGGPHAARAALTTVDRYYLAWMHYQADHGNEPTAQQLSAYLTEKGLYGRGRNPVSPATLRRYLLPYRVYTIWAEHRTHHTEPSLDAIAQDCAARGITAQYNKPLTTGYLTQHAADFERRFHTLTHHHTRPPQPRQHPAADRQQPRPDPHQAGAGDR
ncbi:DUF2637 domain-containing protein, partial [Streptomyces sp. NPDC059862]|uniref:DUF2637 domain-containing protein n=1 Tax=Streptomyces sp. NPDC059862 TaxID=3346975 RepID=UPI00364D87A7